MAATTFRADVRAALVTILEAEKAAHPTHLKKVLPSRPGGFAELPLAYVSNLTEDISWTAGTRTRTLSGAEVTIVDAYREAAEDILDQLVDFLVDRFAAGFAAIPNAIVELTRVADDELSTENPTTGQTTYYRAVVLTFGRTAKWEGRG